MNDLLIGNLTFKEMKLITEHLDKAGFDSPLALASVFIPCRSIEGTKMCISHEPNFNLKQEVLKLTFRKLTKEDWILESVEKY